MKLFFKIWKENASKLKVPTNQYTVTYKRFHFAIACRAWGNGTALTSLLHILRTVNLTQAGDPELKPLSVFSAETKG